MDDKRLIYGNRIDNQEEMDRFLEKFNQCVIVRPFFGQQKAANENLKLTLSV